MSKSVAINQKTIDAYVKDRVFRYFMDCGMSEKVSKDKVDSMTQKDLNKIYDYEPYFEENGY